MEDRLADFGNSIAVRHLKFVNMTRGFVGLFGAPILLSAIILIFYSGTIGENTFARNTPLTVQSQIPAVMSDEARFMNRNSTDETNSRYLVPTKRIFSPVRVASFQNEFYRPYFWPEEQANSIYARILSGARDLDNSELFKGTQALERFRMKLTELDQGNRTKPVVVLHLGDSHISSDSYTSGVRRRLQERYGDSGRGAVIPSNAFKYAYADGVRLKSSGPWRSYMSLKTGKGVFGVSGVRVEANSRKAVMSISSKRGFDYAQVTIATGPDFGSIEITVDEESQRFPTYSKLPGAKTITVNKSGKKLYVRPVGDGKIGVLHWSTLRDNPGVRYVNFGQSGATVNVTRRWNSSAVSNDLETLNPDLIVYGFGTNEGYDDNLNISAYRSYVSKLIDQFRSKAPNADILIIGAADGLRRKRGIPCGAGWFMPKKLGELRTAMQGLANEIGTDYWDWATAMGGPCSINKWARKGWAAKDRVHLTRKGYDVSANAFYNEIFSQTDKQVLTVSKQ